MFGILGYDIAGFSIRNWVDGRIWEVGGEILKDAEGVLIERRKARGSRGVRGHAPPENFEIWVS